MAGTTPHATIFVPPDVAAPIEALRRAWDPGMAAQIAAHVTLAYPEEAPDQTLLVDRLRTVTAHAAPFRLRLRGLARSRAADGVYVVVDDVDGGYRRLRGELLRPPFHTLDFPPHVTLVHPRTSARASELWAKARNTKLDLTFTASEISATAFEGATWHTIETFKLERAHTPG